MHRPVVKYLSRGNAYLARGSAGDLERTITDSSRAIELSPDSGAAHFNRGLLRSELGDWPGSLADLRRAQELSPRTPAYNGALCLQLAVTGDPASGLPYCDRAVAVEAGGSASDSRGIANALLGRRDEAITDFEAFLAWVDTSAREACRSYYGSSRASWIVSLTEGGNPFNAATLHELRPRPTLPGSAPC